MGIDFLDMTFRLEKRFGFWLPPGWCEPIVARREKFDLTAGEVCAAVEARLNAIRQQAPPPEIRRSDPTILDYESRQTTGVYAETRNLAADTDAWPGTREVIAATLGLNPHDVHKHSRLVKDLGMT